MANSIRSQALTNLNLSIADLRNSESRALINAEVDRLRKEAKAATRSNTLRQQQVAIALCQFPGFAAEPDKIGPTLKELHAEIQKSVEGMENVKLSAVRSHLINMRAAGVIASAEVLESEGQGRYPLFFFIEDEATFAQIVNGELVVRKSS
tara:strand:- start:275 stop:727 length:453 start_codon:yes stop_codon:yes gene_type:complete